MSLIHSLKSQATILKLQLQVVLVGIAEINKRLEQVYYLHTTHLDVPLALTDDQGDTAWQASYTPFGKISITLDTLPERFTARFPGQYWDEEKGSYYNMFRDYVPETGRYLQSDPIGLAGGINTYGYAYQNPVMYTDPTGEVGIPGALVGGGIELAMQMAKNWGDWDCVDWADVGISALVGAVAPGSLSVAKNSYKSGTNIWSAVKSIRKGKWVYKHTTNSGRTSTR